MEIVEDIESITIENKSEPFVIMGVLIPNAIRPKEDMLVEIFGYTLCPNWADLGWMIGLIGECMRVK